ncbi:MAG: hypothetical protein HEQ23_05415 [Tepidisphaera sp.]
MSGVKQKVCNLCGLDVSDKPRTKDVQGRYFCQSCSAKSAAQTSPPAMLTSKPAPDPTPLPGSRAVAKPAEAPAMVDPIMEKILGEALPSITTSKDAPAVQLRAATCNACSAAMSPGATVCLVCGYNAQTGKVIKTKVLADRGGGGSSGGSRSGPRVSLGSNTDWNEVSKIAGLIVIFFGATIAVSLVAPIFWLVFVASILVYGLYYMIAMIVQPFLEGRVFWGLYHIAVMTLTVSAAWYGRENEQEEASIIPFLLQIPSLYYVFWLCENNRLKAMWLLSVIGWMIIIALALAGVIAFEAQQTPA